MLEQNLLFGSTCNGCAWLIIYLNVRLSLLQPNGMILHINLTLLQRNGMTKRVSKMKEVNYYPSSLL